MFGKKINALSIAIGILIFLVLILIIILFTRNNAPTKPVLKLVIVEERVEVLKNNNVSLMAYVENVTNPNISWVSSDSNIASVNQNGIITAYNVGTAIMTAEYVHTDGSKYSDTCIVDVIADSTIAVSDVSFLTNDLVISSNSQISLEPIISPSNASYTKIEYSSSDTSVVSVVNSGLITTKGVGRASVKVLIDDYYSDEIYVNVIDEAGIREYVELPHQISFETESVDLEVGDVHNLIYQLSPSDSNEKFLIWESSNSDVASVSKGVVTAKSSGATIITVKTLSGITSNVTVRVKPNVINVTDISLTASKTDLIVGDEVQFTYKVLPENATNKNVSFTSSDTSVATVSNTGLVTAKKKGTAVITVTTEDGNKSFSVKIDVTAKSSSTGTGNSTPITPGQSAYSYVSDYVAPTSTCDSCGVIAQKLIMTFKGQQIGEDSTITMKKGDTITINVTLPSCCGTPLLLKRTSADGQTGWYNYLSATSLPHVNRYDSSTFIKTNKYDWIIRGDKVTGSAVILSQTAKYSTDLSADGIKAMVRVRVKVVS